MTARELQNLTLQALDYKYYLFSVVETLTITEQMIINQRLSVCALIKHWFLSCSNKKKYSYSTNLGTKEGSNIEFEVGLIKWCDPMLVNIAL